MFSRRTGIRARAIVAFCLVALVIVGGTSAAVFATVGPWIYSVARSQAGEQFLREATQLQNNPPSTVAELRERLSSDITAVLNGHMVTVGTAKRADLTPAFTTRNDTQLQVRSQPSGPNRVLFGTVILTRSRDGAPGLPDSTGPPGQPGRAGVQRLELYSIRPLLGVRDKIERTVTVVAIVVVAALVLSALLAAWLAQLVVRPLRRLDEAAGRAARGDASVRLPQQGVPELAALTAKFNQMMRTHQHSLDQSKRFAADVSHELRTPLAALVPASEILEEEKAGLPPDAQVAAGVLIAESRNLARLVEDLIEMSRYDSGQAALDRQLTDLIALSHNVIRQRGWQEAVEVVVRQERLVAEVDPRRFELIVANLIGNAIKHGRPPIILRLHADSGTAVLMVQNAGPVIPADVRGRLFDRFYKGEAARTRTEHQGSGLGLALVKESVQLHQGSVGVDSEPGRTVFTVRLPLHMGDAG